MGCRWGGGQADHMTFRRHPFRWRLVSWADGFNAGLCRCDPSWLSPTVEAKEMKFHISIFMICIWLDRWDTQPVCPRKRAAEHFVWDTKRLKDYIMDFWRYDGMWPLDGVMEPSCRFPFFPLNLRKEKENTNCRQRGHWKPHGLYPPRVFQRSLIDIGTVPPLCIFLNFFFFMFLRFAVDKPTRC